MLKYLAGQHNKSKGRYNVRFLSNTKGTVFITVTIILSVLLIMLSLLLSVTSADVRIANVYSDGVIAYYLAESGAQKAIAYIVYSPKNNFNGLTLTNTNSTFPYSKDYKVDWKIEYFSSNPSDRKYVVTSTAIYNYRATRTIQVLLGDVSGGKIQINHWSQVTK